MLNSELLRNLYISAEDLLTDIANTLPLAEGDEQPMLKSAEEHATATVEALRTMRAQAVQRERKILIAPGGVLPAGLLLLLLFFLPAIASAQAPYGPGFSVDCITDPYLVPPATSCHYDPLTTTYGSRLSVSEGKLGMADHELGYLVLVNPDPQPQAVVAQAFILGRGTVSRRVTLAAFGRFTLDLRSDPVFQGDRVIFTTVVYAERAVSAELLIYAYNAQHPDPFATVTTDKDGQSIPNAR